MWRQADGLGVAAALEVEDAVVAPAVLVVADEDPLGIGRERRLARARQAEEDRHVAVRADVDATSAWAARLQPAGGNS